MSEGFSVHWCALLGAILALTSVAAGIGPGQLPRLDVAFHGMAGEGATPLPPQMQEDTHQGVPTPAVSLYGLPRIRASEEEKADLLELARSRAGEVRLAERAQIVLLAEAGYTAAEIAEEVGTTPKTARKWCRRYLEERSGNADKTVKEWLADAPRVGRKDTFDELFWVDVLAIATSDPETYDRPITHWTSRELAKEVELRRGSFKSTTDLHSRVLKFVEYYNDKLAHPYKFNKWKRIAA